MRQLDGYAGEMTNALMAAHQQIDGVLGGLRLQGSERGNLIQHVTLLWRRKAGAEKAVASSRSSVAKLPVASCQFLPATDDDRQLATGNCLPLLLEFHLHRYLHRYGLSILLGRTKLPFLHRVHCARLEGMFIAAKHANSLDTPFGIDAHQHDD